MRFRWLLSFANYGEVIRDHQGLFVAAKCARIDSDRDPLLAEALAVKEALAWIKELGHFNIIVESNCLNFCHVFTSRCLVFSYVGLVVKQCCVIVRDIRNVFVRHFRRSANHVAHVLARTTGSLFVIGSWVSSPPPCIADLLSY